MIQSRPMGIRGTAARCATAGGSQGGAFRGGGASGGLGGSGIRKWWTTRSARDWRVVQGGGNGWAVVHEVGAGGREVVGGEYGDVGGGVSEAREDIRVRIGVGLGDAPNGVPVLRDKARGDLGPGDPLREGDRGTRMRKAVLK
jgi:hypothetical protein